MSCPGCQRRTLRFTVTPPVIDELTFHSHSADRDICCHTVEVPLLTQAEFSDVILQLDRAVYFNSMKVTALLFGWEVYLQFHHYVECKERNTIEFFVQHALGFSGVPIYVNHRIPQKEIHPLGLAWQDAEKGLRESLPVSNPNRPSVWDWLMRNRLP